MPRAHVPNTGRKWDRRIAIMAHRRFFAGFRERRDEQIEAPIRGRMFPESKFKIELPGLDLSRNSMGGPTPRAQTPRAERGLIYNRRDHGPLGGYRVDRAVLHPSGRSFFRTIVSPTFAVGDRPRHSVFRLDRPHLGAGDDLRAASGRGDDRVARPRSEEHTSELQ